MYSLNLIIKEEKVKTPGGVSVKQEENMGSKPNCLHSSPDPTPAN